MNASWGQRYGGITPLDAINDNCKSHPLYGGSTIIACDGGTYNRIYDVIIALPELRQMLLRRSARCWIAGSWSREWPAQSRLLESHIRYMTNLIWTEAFLDRAKWGYSTWTASNKPLTNAVNELFNEFINLRRIHLNVTHSVTNTAKPIGITPTSNAGIPLVPAAQRLILPIAGSTSIRPPANQDQEYVCVTNPTSVRPGHLRLEARRRHRLHLQARHGRAVQQRRLRVAEYRGRSAHAPSAARRAGPFRGRSLQRPAFRPRRIAHWSMKRSRPDATLTAIPARPACAQQFLRITEIMYHPSAHAANPTTEEFEYIELRNISTDHDAKSERVRFAQRRGLQLHRQRQSPASRPERACSWCETPRPSPPVTAAACRSPASSPATSTTAGERLQFLDASNEEILDFSYNNSWYPITDGLGFSLVVASEARPPDAWDIASQWRPSGTSRAARARRPAARRSRADRNQRGPYPHRPAVVDQIELLQSHGHDVNLAAGG